MTKGISKTNEVWRESYSDELSDEDALEIEANLVRFFALLQEWKQERANTNERNPGGIVDA